MNDFTYYNPVRAHFGKNALEKLSEEVVCYGPNVLLVYGGGSIKRTGLYDRVMDILCSCGKTVTELGGVHPNPLVGLVYEGIRLCRKNSVDLVLAVGGGSAIDTAKAVAAGACTEEDFWQKYYKKRDSVENALPLGVICTLPATGSEMDMSSVLTNPDTNEKIDCMGPGIYPKFTILDPVLTYTLPKNQMVNGIVDTISHIMELYISPPDDDCLTDALAEAAMRTEIAAARIAVKEPENYNARANLMWTSSFALCGMLNNGKNTDWESHCIEQPISALTDIAHGAGLAPVHPAYLEYILPDGAPRLARMAVNVFGVNPEGKTEEQTAREGVAALKAFFAEIGAPATLSEQGVDESIFEAVADLTDLGCYSYRPLTRDDVLAILKAAL